MRHKRFWTVLLTLALVAQPALVRSAEAATYTVDTTVDENDGSCGDGDCSLRDAMILANSNSGPDTINFDISGCGGVCTIQPTSPLPTLTDDGTTIDGYSQPGTLQATDSTSATLLIEIDGSGAGTVSGFIIYSAGNEIKGLAINRFSQYGVWISGSGATGNAVSGNHIGTDASGSTSLGNAWDGVGITYGAQDNTIGGNTAGERNVISGNDDRGVYITGSGTTGNVVSGNYIGTDANGTAALGNAGEGITIRGGAQNNTVGGDTVGERNVISGNDLSGVLIDGSGTTGNTVSGNYIGTDATGTADLGNTWDGVYIGNGAQDNTVGGDTAGERNVISGNDRRGVQIITSGATGNTVSGNYIGTNATGTADLGNAWDGVLISGAQNNTIGPNNVISGNDESGVSIFGSGTTGNVVSGNYIGTDANGTADLGNTSYGVNIVSGAQNNTVGGDTPGERNVISGNDESGVRIYYGAQNNTISGNFIGTNASGTAGLGNTSFGIWIGDGAQNNTVGGDTPGERNVVSGNDQSGVHIVDSGTTGNTVSGNFIGTDATGSADLGNAWDGVWIDNGAQNNTVGGDTPGERNVVSGNDYYGVYITGSGTTGNTISGNYIGTDATGTADLGNSQYGVFISTGAQDNTIGGDTPGERNVISGNNGLSGVYISGSGVTGNVVSGNYIGTNAAGTADLGNTSYGIWIGGGAQDNTVGGDTAGERNVISGNDLSGVLIYGSGTTGNTISGNYIGTDATGTADLGNSQYGVFISTGAQDNTIGGDTPGERNVISGNDLSGVYISGSGVTGNVVSGNTIGTDAAGTADLGNSQYGVYIRDNAQNNTVGPGNVIAYNSWDGVAVDGSGATGNTITQNSIFANDMGIDLMNGANGSIAAPVIVTTTGVVNVVGTACANCTVEVFENDDTDGEGETYVGSTTADATGAFTVTASSLSKPYLTATATDAVSGTSEFSTVFVAEIKVCYLPLVLKSQ